MSKVVIRIGETVKDMEIRPCFAVDLEERKNADDKRIRVRIENEHARLVSVLRAGFEEMLVEKSAMSYCGAKVIITINRVYSNRTDDIDGNCRVDVQCKSNCPREFVEGAYKIYNSIRSSPHIAAAIAEERQKHREELKAMRMVCERRKGNLCSPCKFDCELCRNGACQEVL